jgi:dienelactone hydrolase
VSATVAIRRYAGPILAIHGTEDRVVPVGHLARLAAAARAARADLGDAAAPVETLVIPGGQHSWMYEYPAYRETVARFLATSLGGPLEPEAAARAAVAVDGRRPPDDDDRRFGALDDLPGAVGAPAGPGQAAAEVHP